MRILLGQLCFPVSVPHDHQHVEHEQSLVQEVVGRGRVFSGFSSHLQ